MAGAPEEPPPARNTPEIEAAYQQAPDRVVAEILHGVGILRPRPTPVHARLAGRVYGTLYGPIDLGMDGPGGWVLLPAPSLHLGSRPDKATPDIAGWHLARLPQPPDAAAITVPPDWVCEVLSPSTEVLARGLKMPRYGAHGVRHAWLLDPHARSFEAFRLDAGCWRQVQLARGDERVRAEPFEALELDLAHVWRWHAAAETP